MYIASEDKIEEFASRVREILGERVEEIVLYGSYVRNEHTPGSDIDILILVSETEKDDRKRISELTGEYFTEENLLFSPIILKREEFERKADEGYSFHSEVQKEGVEI